MQALYMLQRIALYSGAPVMLTRSRLNDFRIPQAWTDFTWSQSVMVVFRQRMRAPNKQLPVDLDCISVHHTQCETQKCGGASCPFDPDPLPHPKCQLHPFNHFDIIRHTIGFEVHAEISSFRHLQAPKSYKDHRPFHQSINHVFLEWSE